MIIYRFSIFVTGADYSVNNNVISQCIPIHIYDQWRKGDTYNLSGKQCHFDDSGVQYVHNNVFAVNAETRAQIVRDYISFLKEYDKLFQRQGGNDIEVAASIYMSEPMRFLLFTEQEMKDLICFNNLKFRVDLFLFNDIKMKRIYKDFLKERKEYEKLQNEKELRG